MIGVVKVGEKLCIERHCRDPADVDSKRRVLTEFCGPIRGDFDFTLHLRAFASRAGCRIYGHEQIPFASVAKPSEAERDVALV
jgi:hypothetical protein